MLYGGEIFENAEYKEEAKDFLDNLLQGKPRLSHIRFNGFFSLGVSGRQPLHTETFPLGDIFPPIVIPKNFGPILRGRNFWQNF